MRQNVQKFHTRIMALVTALLLLVPIAVVANAESGTCGDKLKWEVVGSVLTISGKGKMDNYKEKAPAPWSELEITTVQIQSGVTSVGELAFFNMESITAVTLADSVKSVGQYAFYGCSNLNILNLGQGIKTIEQSAFEQCRSLMSLRLPDSLERLEKQAFYSCESLQTITIPKSVTKMGSATFAYCKSMHTAIVNAKIKELPVWTFYGCTALDSVLLDATITETGAEAFAGSAMTHAPLRGELGMEGTLTNSITEKDPQGGMMNQTYVEGDNSAVSTQIGGDGKVTIQADLENKKGWEDLSKPLESVTGSAKLQVQLKGDTVILGSFLRKIAGKDITVQIQMPQGGWWKINGKDLPMTGLKDKYDLNFEIRQLSTLKENQKAVFGEATVFSVSFKDDIDFKAEVMLPLGGGLARHRAAFFVEENDTYTAMQQVLMDDAGRAHFYMQHLKKGEAYLVGIDVEAQQDVAPIIPDALHNDYGVDQEKTEYINLGPKSSWGLDVGQVTWILVGVMGGSVIVVGGVLMFLNKRKLKKGYIPELDDEEE